MLSRDKLDAIEARAKAATLAPWCTGSIPWQVWFDGGHGKICRIESTAEDRDFIAHARQDVPALIAEVRRQWGDGPFTCGHEPQYAGGSCAACHALLLEKVQGLELQVHALREAAEEKLAHDRGIHHGGRCQKCFDVDAKMEAALNGCAEKRNCACPGQGHLESCPLGRYP